MFYAALALGIVATIVFLVTRVRKGGIPGLITKTTASVFFILTAVFACVAKPEAISGYGIYIVAGLIFGMLGDIWLDLKWVYPNDNDIYTYAGMVSFGLGHVFFLYAIYSVSGVMALSLWYFFIPLIVAILFGFVAILMEKPMKLEYGKFKFISMAYGAILAFMTFASATAYNQSGYKNTMWLVMTLGGVFFIISDLILSGIYFDKEKSKNTPINVVLNHATYYIAQFLIASSIMYFI